MRSRSSWSGLGPSTTVEKAAESIDPPRPWHRSNWTQRKSMSRITLYTTAHNERNTCQLGPRTAAHPNPYIPPLFLVDCRLDRSVGSARHCAPRHTAESEEGKQK